VTQGSFWREQAPSLGIALGNVFAIGLGMGVPAFAILLALPVGWWLGARYVRTEPTVRGALRSLVLAAAGLAAVSFVVLLVVWGPHIPKAFDPAVDAVSYGIPLILYTSRASMIGWFVLMLVISPVVQFMAVASTGAVAMLVRLPRSDGGSEGDVAR
jgi:hypothetical protein